MSPSRGDDAAVGGVGVGGGEGEATNDDSLGPSASAAATEEGGTGWTPAPAPSGEGHGRRGAFWKRWRVGLALFALVAVAVGLTLRGGATAGPGPGSGAGAGDADSSGWQGQQQQQQQLDDGVPSGLTEGKQQQPSSSSSSSSSSLPVATAPTSVVKSPAAKVPGQAQAAGAASALTDLAKQLLGEGGGNRDPGGGLFEGEEEDEAEGTFIAVEGCTPSNGGELHFVVERSTCPVITLLPGVFYNLTEYIVVRRPVLIVGRPLNPPTIDAHLAYRAFLVEAGGALDLRHVVIYRGKPIEVIKPQLYYEIRGAAAYIRNGGAAFFTDCVMLLYEENPVSEVLVTSNPRTTVRIIGGFLLLEAGTLHVVGCHILVQRPGVLFREVYTVGGFILVMQGTLLLTGSTLTASFLFISVAGLGNFVTVLGGNAIITGVVFTLNGGFVAGNGAGLLQFIGGGVAVFTGSVSQGNLLFLSFFGAGMGQFTGGGVSILTGMVFNAVSIMNFGAGVGFNNGLGAGVMVKTGVTQSGSHSQSALAVLGVATFVGAGTVVYSEVAWNRNTALTAYYGGGGSLYLGTGVATIVNSVSTGATATVIAAAAGGDHVIFAGWLTMVNSWFFKWVVIAAYYGQGVDTCIVAGGALLVNCGNTGTPPIVGANRGLYSTYVAGRGVVLNDSTDVVLVTHKTYWVRDRPDKRHLSESKSGGNGLKLKGGLSPLPPGPARLELRRVQWRDASLEQFKQAIKETAKGGQPLQWPWKLRAMMDQQEADEDERRQRRQAQGRGEEEPAVAAAVVLEPSGQEQGAEALLVPLYPGSPVLVPRADLRPMEGPKAASRVYVASPLLRCRACGVRASGGGAAATTTTTTTTTADAFAGVGAEGCEFSEACANDEDDAASYSDIMWMAAPGSGRMPNTSLAIVDLVVASATAEGPEPQRLLRAINSTIASLGLGPPRYHLRVLPASVPLPYDPPAEGGRLLRLLQEQEATAKPGVGADAAAPCPLRVPFKAYLVSDRPEVVSALAKGLRQPAAAAAMTVALQQEEAKAAAAAAGGGGSAAAAVACGVRAWRAVQTHIPGLNASALLQPQPPAPVGANKAGLGPSTTGIARLLAAAGKMRPVPTVLFGGGDGDQAQPPQGGRALAAAPATAPVHPTAALLVHGAHADEEEEEEDDSRVAEIRAGETYTLALARFPPGRRLRVRLVPAAGPGALLQVLPSRPQGARARQGWAWNVDAGLAPGKYFLEVASHARDAFAYSQAFEVLPLPGPETGGQ